MSAKQKKEAPAPARDEAGTEPGLQDSPLVPTVPLVPTRAADDAANEKKSLSAPAQQLVPTRATEELWADPWAAAKTAGLLVERIVQKCPGRTERSDAGIWKVTPAVLEACGLAPERARAAVEVSAELRPRDLEGAVVYALSGPGRVAVMSAAKKPRSSRVLAQVREPSRLRCGDEVAIRYTESGRAEVVHGR